MPLRDHNEGEAIDSMSDQAVRGPFAVGPWLVEPVLNRLSSGTDQCHLEPRAMAVLVELARHAGEVVSTEQLIARVWHGRPMGDNPVYKCIGQLRKAMGDDAQKPRIIATVPKRGYRLIAPVSLDPPHAGQSGAGRMLRRSGIASGIVLVVIAAVLLWSGRSPQPPVAAESAGSPLAVMPFSFDDESLGATAEVLTAQLASSLAGVPGVRVITRESARLASGVDITQALQRLRAAHAVVGNVQHEGSALSVVARLVDGQGDTVWERQWPAREADLPHLAGLIAREVAGHLGLDSASNGPLDRPASANVDAVRHYLLAHEHLRIRGPDYKRRAIERFKQALVHDPGFVAAQAGLARAYLAPDESMPWPEAYERAEGVVQRSLDNGARSARLHHARGLLQMTDREGPCPPVCRDLAGYADAERSFRAALQLQPDLADAHNGLAIALTGQGRIAEAFGHLQQALISDPLNPVVSYNLALHLSQRGDRAAALQLVDEFLNHHPSPPDYMHGMRIHVEERFGNHMAAMHHFNQSSADWPADTRALHLGRLYFHLGMHDRIQGLLDSTDLLVDRRAAAFYLDWLNLRGDQEALESYLEMLLARAGGPPSDGGRWPRWMLQAAGKSLALLERHEQAVDFLHSTLGENGDQIDHQNFVSDLETLHYLAWSLQQTGQHERAMEVVERSVGLISERQAQGYEGYPEQTMALARAHALRADDRLALAAFERAVAEGWRGYWAVVSDPRWDAMRQIPEFTDRLSRIGAEVKRVRDSVAGEY